MDADLRSAHERLAGILGEAAEPLEVLERVEEHRVYWRPAKVRVVLLAESHVYTTSSEMERRLRRTLDLPTELPKGFVRLVYCLGYGENELLDERISKNDGTPQFWKIFKSCLTEVGQQPDFSTLQRSPNTGAVLRLREKLAVLVALRDHGVWLVDASVAALYRPEQSPLTAKQKMSALRASWDGYVRAVVEAVEPEAVLCIGIGVVRCLRERLDQLGIRWAGVPQPQAHLSRDKHAAIHEVYSAVCADPTEIRNVPAV
jgi:hypothetical protein